MRLKVLLQREELSELFIPYKKTAMIIVAIAIIQAVLQAIILLSMKPLLKDSIKSTEINSIYLYGGLLLILVAIHGICAVAVSRYSAKITSDIAEKTRYELFRRVLMTDELDTSGDTSGMMIRLMNDIDNVQRTVTEFLRSWLYTLFLTLSLIVVSFVIDVKLGLLMFSVSLIVYVIIIHTAKVEFKSRRDIIDRLETVIRTLRGYIKGAKNRRYLGCLGSDHVKFRDISGDYSKLCDDTRIRAFRHSNLARLVFTGTLCIFVIIYFIFIESTTVYFGNLVLFLQMALLLETSLTLYPFFIESIPIASASVEKINSALKYSVKTTGVIPEDSDSKYIIRSEDRRYPSIIRGQETAIITMADAGAWDFTQIMVGTRNAVKGKLFFNGTDMADIDHGYITSKVAYAGSKALTFDGTLFDNIDLSRNTSKERITEVCRVLSIEKPLDFIIERSSSNISAGESFKISLARALISDADIYVFEYCFILLDHHTKKRIVNYIRSELAGKTVIFITPNTAIAEGADNIAIISDGEVICNDIGTVVKGSNDLYRELYRDRGCSLE